MAVDKNREQELKKMKIAVIGLGKAGLPLAAVIAEAGFEVIGVDLDEKRCSQINNGDNPIPEEAGLGTLIKKYGGKNLTATSTYADTTNCRFFIVIVPLFIDEQNNADFSILEHAFRNVGKVLKKGDCIVLETTVPPGTTETMVKAWLEKESGLAFGDFYLAHSPERIMTGFSISRLKEFPKIIGGVDAASGQKAYEVYKQFIGSLSLVSSARVAEFIKVIEGCYRFTNIALANELFKIADELDIDFFEAQKAANHEFCHIHLPSTGVGGHCIPVYPWFLIKQMQQKQKEEYTTLLHASHTVNEDMIEFFAQRILQDCKKINKPVRKVRICIAGITFRKGVKSTYKSRNVALAKHLQKLGMNVFVYDELYSKEEIEQMNLSFLKPEKADVVFDPFTLKITIVEQ
jgi:UDP-N-acetyl-D-mannosaminuronic acid dehydrogenase